MQIGELFILRINIHLNGSVLDTPELFWVEPQLEPLYQAARSYLEMDQRVGLVTERLDVIADLLAVLKDQLTHGHGEMLEWIGMFHSTPLHTLLSLVLFFWRRGFSGLLTSLFSYHSDCHGNPGGRDQYCSRLVRRGDLNEVNGPEDSRRHCWEQMKFMGFA